MKVRLIALTPIHIGGREGALNPLEFVLFEGRCYVVSEDKLGAALQEQNKLDLFYAWFTRRYRPALYDFLREQRLLDARFLKRVAAYSSATLVRIEREMRPCVRDAFSHPFIPGTSLKGAIRTAVLYKSLKDLTPELRKEFLDDRVADRLDEYDRDPRAQRYDRRFQNNFKQRFSQKLDANFFQRFTLSERSEYDPHTDVFRCLRVTDSVPLSRDVAQVEEVKIYSAHSAESPKDWSFYVECLPAGSVIELELSVDEVALVEFRKKNRKTWFETDFSALEEMLRNPLQVWAEMGQDLWQEETQFFAKEFGFSDVMPKNKGQPMVRVGWGGGLLATSVDMLLPQPLRRRLRNILFDDRDTATAPKSRRLIENGNEHIPLGWATVEQVK
jgi:CRISPR-associated protein Csm5